MTGLHQVDVMQINEDFLTHIPHPWTVTSTKTVQSDRSQKATC